MPSAIHTLYGESSVLPVDAVAVARSNDKANRLPLATPVSSAVLSARGNDVSESTRCGPVLSPQPDNGSVSVAAVKDPAMVAVTTRIDHVRIGTSVYQ
jgi:hypothetical protein